MDTLPNFFSNKHGHYFVNAEAYFYSQVTEIFENAKIKNKKKRRIPEVITTPWQSRGHGRGLWQSDRCNGGNGHGIVGCGGRGCVGGPDRPYNTWNGVDIWEISSDFGSANWDDLQGGSQSYVSHQHILIKAVGGRGKYGTCEGHGHGEGRHIPETDADWSDYVHVGCGHRGRVKQNGARFGRGAYWLLRSVALAICWIFK